MHAGSDRHPLRQCLVDLDPLTPIDQECALPQLEYQYLVVNMLKSLGKINKDCLDKMAGVDSTVPVM